MWWFCSLSWAPRLEGVAYDISLRHVSRTKHIDDWMRRSRSTYEAGRSRSLPVVSGLFSYPDMGRLLRSLLDASTTKVKHWVLSIVVLDIVLPWARPSISRTLCHAPRHNSFFFTSIYRSVIIYYFSCMEGWENRPKTSFLYLRGDRTCPRD